MIGSRFIRIRAFHWLTVTTTIRFLTAIVYYDCVVCSMSGVQYEWCAVWEWCTLWLCGVQYEWCEVWLVYIMTVWCEVWQWCAVSLCCTLCLCGLQYDSVVWSMTVVCSVTVVYIMTVWCAVWHCGVKYDMFAVLLWCTLWLWCVVWLHGVVCSMTAWRGDLQCDVHCALLPCGV